MKKTITIDISKEFLAKGTLRFSAQTKKGSSVFESMFGWGISSVDINPKWEDCFEDELKKQAPYFDEITIYQIGD